MIRFFAFIMALSVVAYAVFAWRQEQFQTRNLAIARADAMRCGFPVNWVMSADRRRGDPQGMVAFDEHLNLQCATDQQHAVRKCMERELKKSGVPYRLPDWLGNCVSLKPVPIF